MARSEHTRFSAPAVDMNFSTDQERITFMKKRLPCFLPCLLVGLALALIPSCTNVRFVGPLTITNTFGLMGSGASAYLDKQIDRIAPAHPNPADKRIFASYQENGPSQWAPNWTRS